MTVWSHLPTIFNQRYALRIAGILTLCVALITTLFLTVPARAVSGVNETISFQGRLLTASGGLVADGYYNIQFNIYQDGTGTADGNPGGTLKWTENRINNGGTSGVLVKNGYFSVELGSVTPFGSSVDWNQDTLWLSMNVAGSSAGCTTFGSGTCTADGEMLPMKRLTSTPFAMNAARLGGKSAADFLQNSMTLQTGNLWLDGIIRAGASISAPALDTGSAQTLSIGTSSATAITIGQVGVTTSIDGELEVAEIDTTGASSLEIGSSNATSINLNQDVTVAAGKSLTLVGGNTASRPASPTEGMLYFDTETKQLLTYANGKWQADRSTASKTVGTSASGGTSSAVASLSPDGADYVNTSTTSAHTTINSALSALATTGGTVYLMEGTYIIDGSISIPNNVTLTGAGSGTIIKLKNGINANLNAIVATDSTTGTGVTVSNLRLDGNKTNNSSGTQTGIYFLNMGGGNGVSARQGAKLNNLWIANLRNYGIMLEDSNNGIISDNHLNNSNMGLYLKNTAYLTVTGNIIQYHSRGIYATPTYFSTLSNNTIESSTAYGMLVDGTSANNTISGNNILTSTTAGLALATANDNLISGNRVRNSGGNTTNEAITLNSNSVNNTITGNMITDSSATTNNYAIAIKDSGSTGNYLADNTLGGATVSDASASTVYAGQTNAAGNYVLQPAGTVELMKNTNVTGSLSATTAVLAPEVDRATAGTLTIGSTNATSITIGRASANTATSFLGTAVFKPTTGNDSTIAFQLQRANGTAMFVADSTNQTITIGDPSGGNKIVISTATGQLTKFGTARNVKSIVLTPEYSGAVLDAQSDSACTSASNGTMTAGLDSVGRTNYYNWTSTQSTNQCYDVVVQIPVPAGFSGWQSNSILMKASNTSNASYGIAIIDSAGNYDANYGSSYATPGTLSTSWSNIATSSLSGTYTANDYFTVKIRMTAKNAANLQLGNITLGYYSNE